MFYSLHFFLLNIQNLFLFQIKMCPLQGQANFHRKKKKKSKILTNHTQPLHIIFKTFLSQGRIAAHNSWLHCWSILEDTFLHWSYIFQAN